VQGHCGVRGVRRGAALGRPGACNSRSRGGGRLGLALVMATLVGQLVAGPAIAATTPTALAPRPLPSGLVARWSMPISSSHWHERFCPLTRMHAFRWPSAPAANEVVSCPEFARSRDSLPMTHVRLMTWRYRQVAGWGSLIASALLFASLLDAGVTNGTGGVVQAVPTDTHSSAATPALTDSNDVVARFLSTDAPKDSCDVAPGQPLYAGLNTWVAQTQSDCEISRP
jgi:hypothetical protein